MRLPPGVTVTMLRLAVKLPVRVRRRLTWLSQATFTVGVSGVILNERDEILLLRHRFRESNAWELPGGFVERGESLDGALHRELREETGLDVVVTCHVDTHLSRARHIDVAYLARTRSGTLRVDDAEILDARFFPYTDLPPDLSPDQLRIIGPALDMGGENQRATDTPAADATT